MKLLRIFCVIALWSGCSASISSELEEYLSKLSSSSASRIFDMVEMTFEGSNNLALHKVILEALKHGVHFWLFTRDSPDYEKLVMGDADNLTGSNFNSERPTKIVIHGWMSGYNGYSAKMKDALLEYTDCNIIIVNWSDLSHSLYTISRLSVKYIGLYVAQFLDFLFVAGKVQSKDIHILGHSLGAHIAGVAGLYTQSKKVGRITGFDPAGPEFIPKYTYTLCNKSAEFVDVIHTSIDFLGMKTAIGHADFYPNGGGPGQPGCTSIKMAICVHRRSYDYYLETLNPETDTFVATQCGSMAEFEAAACNNNTKTLMGEHCSTSARGTYFLHTNDASPFGKGDEVIEPPPPEDDTDYGDDYNMFFF